MNRITTKMIIVAIITIGFMVLASFQLNQNQIPYLLTKLSLYSGTSLSSITMEMSAKLETGLEENLQIQIGTGKQGNLPLYWMMIESSLFVGKTTSYFDLSNKSSNICNDTIRHKFRGDTAMVAFEIIHHLSTNEIQYIWLDGDNNRSRKAVIIPLDHPLKEGKIFSDLTVEKLNGGKLSIKDLVGKTLVINWWHTGCGPCIAEMPGFNKLVEQYKENPNIVFIAIAHNKKDDVTRFLESREFNYIQTLANEDAVKLFKDTYPVNIIVNSMGKICYYSKGGSEYTHILIERALKTIVD